MEARLPAEVATWLQHQRRPIGGLDGGPGPLVASDAVGRFVVRFLPARNPLEPDTLSVERAEKRLDAERLQGLGLSGRQAEVLRLVALGNTNAEVADALHISARTVEKPSRRSSLASA